MLSTLAALVPVLSITALPALMFAQGLGIDARRDLRVDRARWKLIVAGVAATLLVVPLVSLPLIVLVPMERDVAVALAILAACPLAPTVHAKIPQDGGDRPFAAIVHVISAAASVVTTPLVLVVLGRIIGFRAFLPPEQIALDLAGTVFLPLGAGVLVRARVPAAVRFEAPLTAMAAAAYSLVLFALLARRWRVLLDVDPLSYVAFGLFVVIALGVGEVAAGRAREHAPTLAIECAARNPAAALAVASWSYPYLDPTALLVPFVVVFVAVTAFYARVRMLARRSLRRRGPASPASSGSDVAAPIGDARGQA